MATDDRKEILDKIQDYLDVTSIAEAATASLTAADSGKTFWIDGSTSAATYTLPAPSAGLYFRWKWTANCNNAVIIQTADITDTTGDMLKGGVLVCAAADNNLFIENGANVNTATFDDNVANSAAGAGSWVEVICTEDPTWYIRGILNSTTDADTDGSAIFSNAD